MEELTNKLRRELRSLSQDQLDVLCYRFIDWLKLSKRRQITTEQRITEVLQLISKVKTLI